jgi:probable rRNA maturation factor
MPIKISIAFDRKKKRQVPHPLMRKVVRTVLEGERTQSAIISLAFVDDATSARINKSFLNHSGPTDVISFPLSEPNTKTLVGELVISVDVALRVATERGHDVQAELALYVIHGLLHLCGYDDKTKTARTKMRFRQRQYLERLRLPAISD